MFQYLAKFYQLLRGKRLSPELPYSFLRQGIKHCHNDGRLVIIRKICLLLSSCSSICEWRSVSFVKKVLSLLTVKWRNFIPLLQKKWSICFIFWLTQQVLQQVLLSRSFLKIEFLFPKSQLNDVTCSCHCKRVWVTTVVHTKHWPAFLVWTWELLAQKKKTLLQQFHMNRASGLPVSPHQCNCLAWVFWIENMSRISASGNFFSIYLFTERNRKIALESFFVWFQECGKSRDVTVMLQPRCILPFCVTHKSLVWFLRWRTIT